MFVPLVTKDCPRPADEKALFPSPPTIEINMLSTVNPLSAVPVIRVAVTAETVFT